MRKAIIGIILTAGVVTFAGMYRGFKESHTIYQNRRITLTIFAR